MPWKWPTETMSGTSAPSMALVELWERAGVPRYNRDWLVSQLEAGIKKEFVLFWRPTDPMPIAQLGHSPFQVDQRNDTCADHCMMAEKARLFVDKALEQQILATSDQATMKRLAG